MTLSQSIVDLVVGCARTEGMCTVTRVVVEIGVTEGVDPEALRFCFHVVADDTAARGLPKSQEQAVQWRVMMGEFAISRWSYSESGRCV
jgi:Zn finger protein HypA/HybF involved in hydrogenase expression